MTCLLGIERQCDGSLQNSNANFLADYGTALSSCFSLVSTLLSTQAGINIITEGGDLSFYQYCPKEPKENLAFTKKIPLCVPEDEIQASLPLWIPFFIKFHVGDRWR